VGRDEAAPILLKVFDLLPADRRPKPKVPAGAVLATTTDQLPPALRIFRREQAEEPPEVAELPPPSISFPPNGATVPIAAPSAKDKNIVLRADGGKEPLTWLVNGELLGSFDRFAPVLYAPNGEGPARVTVVDAEGRSDTAQVRFKKIR